MTARPPPDAGRTAREHRASKQPTTRQPASPVSPRPYEPAPNGTSTNGRGQIATNGHLGRADALDIVERGARADRGGDVVRLLIADHMPVFARQLARATRDDPGSEVTAQTRDGYQALELIRERCPDVALVEVGLPGLDGLGVLNAATREELPTAIILIGARVAPACAYVAATLGARGFLIKDAEPDELLGATKAVAAGQVKFCPQATTALNEEVRRIAEQPRLDPISRRILQLTANGHAAYDISLDVHLQEASVKARLRKLYKLLGVRCSTAAACEALRRGLID